jgi:hypothetical protein
MAFLTHRIAGHHHVIPADAVPLLQDGRLDGRLFDVTAQLDFGYDDRGTTLPLIITGAPVATRAAATTAGATVVRDLPVVGAVAVRASKVDAAAFWNGLRADSRSQPARIWLDGLRKPALDVSVPQVGAPAAWQAGFDGTGRTAGASRVSPPARGCSTARSAPRPAAPTPRSSPACNGRPTRVPGSST